MNTRAATLIAERLQHGGLIHPGDPNNNQPPFAIPLPGLRSTGIPPDMARHFANQAGFPTTDTPKLIGQALVHLLETDGNITLIDNAELTQLRQDAADAPDGARVIEVRCASHNTELLHLTIGKTDQLSIPCRTLAQALEAH